MNLSFKIPTWLFLIAIVLLVIFVLYKICSNSEGFINYNAIATFNSDHQLPDTDASGYKLYDNNYFYPESGKIIRVWGQENVEGASGEDIQYVELYDRNGNSERIDASSTEVDGLKVYSLDSSVNVAGNGEDLPAMYNHWYTKTVPSAYADYANNQLYYVNYGYVTYMHVINNNASNTSTNNFGYLQSQDELAFVEYTAPMNVDYKASSSFTAGPANDVSVGGKTLKDCYQVATNVYYNINNGDLYIDTSTDSESSLQIYQRSTNGAMLDEAATADYVFPTTKNLSSNNTARFIAKDNKGGNLVVYVAKQYTTMILILRREQSGSSNGVYSLGTNNVFRFGQDGLVQFNYDDGDDSSGDDSSGDDSSGDDSSGDDSSGNDSSGNDSSGNDSNDPPAPDSDEDMNEYWKWYWYWNSTNTPIGGYSNDYMLKTQVVPPVCPACPSGGNCNNCGGNGGSGTMDACGNSVVNDTNLSGTLSTTVTTVGDVAGKALDSGTDALNKTLDTTSDLLKSAGSGALELTNTVLDGAGNLISGTGQLARDAASGTVDIAYDTVSGTSDFVKDSASGTADFIRDVGRGPHNAGGPTYGYGGNATNSYYQQHGRLSGNQLINHATPAMDPYTYNGQLPQRGESSFVPRTNSFAAFSK
jgi:hypothetical protein